MKIITLLLLLTSMYGCSPTDSVVTDVLISEIGADSPDLFCKDFSLSNKQVTEFFEKSREVEIRELHDNYEYLPCYVKGSLKKGGEICKFIIRAGGTAELTCDDQAGYLFVCDSCDDLLGGT